MEKVKQDLYISSAGR